MAFLNKKQIFKLKSKTTVTILVAFTFLTVILLFVMLKNVEITANFSLGSFNVKNYTQSKNVFAQENEEEEVGRLTCGKEIPSGEAMERTGQLIQDLIKELNIIDENAQYQIEAAEEMIELADQCGIENCQPAGCGVNYDTGSSIYTCNEPPCGPWNPFGSETCNCPNPPQCFPAQDCTSPWENKACPQNEIEQKHERVEYFYGIIKSARDEVFGLIDGKRESLCDKLNEDIRTNAEKVLCLGCPTVPNPLCPEITIIESIRRKLDKTRSEFDKCYLPCPEWIKVHEGERAGKYLFNCELVMGQDFPRETKTIEKANGEEMPVCTSLHNWFCCY